MDEQENHIQTLAFAHGDSESDGNLACKRIAFLDGIDDPEGQHSSIERLVVQAGGFVVAFDDPQIEVLVVDSAITSSDLLRERLDAESLQRLQDGQIQIVSHDQLRQFLEQPEPIAHRLLTRRMLGEILSVNVATLRRWQRRGLIQPVSTVNRLDYFDFQEVAAAKQLATLVELGLDAATIQQNLRQLSVWMPEVVRPLNQLPVFVEGNQILLRWSDGKTEGLVEASGQRRLDFGIDQSNLQTDSSPCYDDYVSDEAPADILPFSLYIDPNGDSKASTKFDPHIGVAQGFQTMSDHVAAAEVLEEEGDIAEAIHVYRSAQLAFGPHADISLRIGELLFRTGDLSGARERYFMAIELDEFLIEARAALGCVLVELGEVDLAISVFQGAIEHHADYADVHFHLARALQTAGDEVQAIKHWQRFLLLSPSGPWFDEAKSQLEFLGRM